MSDAAQAHLRTSRASSSPREIEAQAKLKSLIEINCNLAAGLFGRG